MSTMSKHFFSLRCIFEVNLALLKDNEEASLKNICAAMIGKLALKR